MENTLKQIQGLKSDVELDRGQEPELIVLKLDEIHVLIYVHIEWTLDIVIKVEAGDKAESQVRRKTVYRNYVICISETRNHNFYSSIQRTWYKL